MADTFTQLYIQFVFAVKGRQSLISKKMKAPLEKYIQGIVKNKGCQIYSIFCDPDHVHILVSLNPKNSISDLVRDIKANSAKWVNQNGMTKHKFNRQNGFGAFSYSKQDRDKVIGYIANQEEHHRKATFISEYRQLLEENEIDFKPEYLFEEIE